MEKIDQPGKNPAPTDARPRDRQLIFDEVLENQSTGETPCPGPTGSSCARDQDRIEFVLVRLRDQFTADSRELAAVMDLEHELVLRLIEQNSSFFIRLGDLRFEAVNQGGADCRSQAEGPAPDMGRYALLNSSQSFLLVALVPMTPVTAEFKLRFVKVFARIRNDLATARNQWSGEGILWQEHLKKEEQISRSQGDGTEDVWEPDL